MYRYFFSICIVSTTNVVQNITYHSECFENSTRRYLIYIKNKTTMDINSKKISKS